MGGMEVEKCGGKFIKRFDHDVWHSNETAPAAYFKKPWWARKLANMG